MEITGARFNATIGNVYVDRAPYWCIESRRHTPYATAGITLPDPTGRLFQTIKRGDLVAISYGYRNQAPAAWFGTVSFTLQGNTRDQLQVLCADAGRALVDTRLKLAWENESAGAILRYSIQQTGLPLGTIGSPQIMIPRFPAGNINVYQISQQLARTCQKSFDRDMAKWALWLGADGVNWGDFYEPGETAVIATGGLLINHLPDNAGPYAAGMVEAFLQPGLSHSRPVKIVDYKRDFQGQFRVQRVRHAGTPDSVRTYVWYGTEFEKY